MHTRASRTWIQRRGPRTIPGRWRPKPATPRHNSAGQLMCSEKGCVYPAAVLREGVGYCGPHEHLYFGKLRPEVVADETLLHEARRADYVEAKRELELAGIRIEIRNPLAR